MCVFFTSNKPFLDSFFSESVFSIVYILEICIDIRRRSVTSREIFRTTNIKFVTIIIWKKTGKYGIYKNCATKMSENWEKSSPVRMHPFRNIRQRPRPFVCCAFFRSLPVVCLRFRSSSLPLLRCCGIVSFLI